jgi:hypothetical protein
LVAIGLSYGSRIELELARLIALNYQRDDATYLEGATVWECGDGEFRSERQLGDLEPTLKGHS